MDISFIILLLICSIIDIKKRIVPNSCIVLLLVLGIIKTVVNISIGYPWWFNLTGIIYTIPFFIAWLNSKMGAGEVKLILVISLYLGVFNSLFVFKMLKKDFRKSIPLVPFIMIGYLSYIVIQFYILINYNI